jgi:GlpG protein
MIGHVRGESGARQFGDYLLVNGIENQVEPDQADAWAVWVHSEEQLGRAQTELAEFLAHPTDPRFKASAAAKDLRAEKQKEQAAYEKRVQDRRNLLRPLAPYSFGPVTFSLICMSLVVFILAKGGNDFSNLWVLFITDPRLFSSSLPEIQHGEIWRLITPIFIHFGFWHILFNALCLMDFGSMVEARQSSRLYCLLVLLFSILPNLAQFFWSGAMFGGLSGVTYGLAGYIWIRGKRDPGSGLFLHPSSVTMLLVWLFLGFTGIMHTANAVHATALLLGMGWGYLSSLKYR